MAHAESPCIAQAVPESASAITATIPHKKKSMQKTNKNSSIKTAAKNRVCPHPTYLQMSAEAIFALKDRTGSSTHAIAKWMEGKYCGLLPGNFKKLLHYQLKRQTEKGNLLQIKNSYKLSEELKRYTQKRQKEINKMQNLEQKAEKSAAYNSQKNKNASKKKPVNKVASVKAIVASVKPAVKSATTVNPAAKSGTSVKPAGKSAALNSAVNIPTVPRNKRHDTSDTKSKPDKFIAKMSAPAKSAPKTTSAKLSKPSKVPVKSSSSAENKKVAKKKLSPTTKCPVMKRVKN